MALRFAATLLTALATACVPSLVSAEEAWPAQDRELLLDIDAFTSFASSQYQHTGDVIDLIEPASDDASGRYQALGLAIDAEFGLVENIAVFVVTTLSNNRIISDYATAGVSGLADFTVGGKWRLIEKAFSVTIAPAVKFPTGYAADAGEYMPSLGNGVNEYEARIWAGKKFDDAPFYFELGSGYRFRGTRVPRGGGPKVIYSDEIPYDLLLGFDVTDKIGLRLFVDGIVGLGKPDVIDHIELRPVTEDYTRIGGAAGYAIRPNIGLFAEYRATVAGINALNAQYLALNLQFGYGIE